MNDLVVEVNRRESRGKNNARRMRRGGEMPAVVYGDGKDPVAIAVDPEHIVRILQSESGANTIFKLNLAGTDQSRHVMIKEYQIDPIDGDLMHADFLRIKMDALLEVSVPVRLLGEAVGVKLDGGILEHVTREVEVSCLPGDIPEHIDIDISGLKIGDHIKVADLPKDDRVRILTDEGQTLAICIPPAKEEEAAADTEEAAAAPTEPEVLKKDNTDADKPEEDKDSK